MSELTDVMTYGAFLGTAIATGIAMKLNKANYQGVDVLNATASFEAALAKDAQERVGQGQALTRKWEGTKWVGSLFAGAASLMDFSAATQAYQSAADSKQDYADADRLFNKVFAVNLIIGMVGGALGATAGAALYTGATLAPELLARLHH